MKKYSKNIFVFFTVALILIVGIYLWQFQNINTLIKSFVYSNSQITTQIEETKQDLMDEISPYVGDSVRNFTPEEEKKIVSGELSVEQATDLIIKPNANSQQSNTNKNSNPPTENDIIAKYTANLMALKASFIGQLGSFQGRIINDYLALPADQQNSSSKKSILVKYMMEVSKLEKSCDSQVTSTLNNLETELKSIGASTDIVSILQKEYTKEKNLKKSYYLNLYKSHM